MLPTIHLTDFIDGSSAARQAIAGEIARTCEEVGFFYIDDHGVPEPLLAELRAAAEGFFALPREEKLRVRRPRGRYRGYIPASQFNETADGRPPVHYEAYLTGIEIAEGDPAVDESGGLIMPNVWPVAPKGFREVVLAYQAEMARVSEALLRAFALALGGGEERLLAYFDKPLSNSSLLHYLPRPKCSVARPDDARAHYDTNALTVLLPGEVGGLEAMMPSGDWREVPPRPGSFVVNIGNMMACWSGGRFKSTMHRVQPPLGVDRYSIAYFACPGYDTRVAPLDGVRVVDGEACEEFHAGRALAEFVADCDAMVPVEP
jgi:isopenicillin N synthase-like dioxygenase